MEYRNELKFIVSTNDLEILYNRLKNVLTLDQNIKEEKKYNIRSIYFDDWDNTYFYENESGINKRLKIRIRIYDKSDKIIKLEIKHKYNGMTKKESCTIDKPLFKKILESKLTIQDCKNNRILNKVYIEQKTNLLKPKIIVEYDRTAFINEVGNVRITFDKNIRASKYINRFFLNNIYAKPINLTDMHVLEVKYDEVLPGYIVDLLELNTLNKTAFSKYYLSRISLGDEII